jgi:ligand-binding sensor domain-containing protein
MLLFTRKYLTIRFYFLIVVLLSSPIYTQSVTFNHLTVEDGLSNNDVNTLIQDKTGFIWFGTEDGLNRFDGYDFRVFRNDPSDSNSISNNSVWALLEDKQGSIWIGTKDEKVSIFNPITTISFSIPEASFISLKIFGALGKQIETLVAKELNAGNYKYDWKAKNLTSGVYFYKLQTENFIETKKMILLK